MLLRARLGLRTDCANLSDCRAGNADSVRSGAHSTPLRSRPRPAHVAVPRTCPGLAVCCFRSQPEAVGATPIYSPGRPLRVSSEQSHESRPRRSTSLRSDGCMKECSRFDTRAIGAKPPHHRTRSQTPGEVPAISPFLAHARFIAHNSVLSQSRRFVFTLTANPALRPAGIAQLAASFTPAARTSGDGTRVAPMGSRTSAPHPSPCSPLPSPRSVLIEMEQPIALPIGSEHDPNTETRRQRCRSKVLLPLRPLRGAPDAPPLLRAKHRIAPAAVRSQAPHAPLLGPVCTSASFMLGWC